MPGAFIPNGEEGLVSPVVKMRQIHRSAHKNTKLVEVVRKRIVIASRERIFSAPLCKVVCCVQCVVAEELIRISVQLVSTRLGDDVEKTTARLSELRGRIGCNHLELIDHLDRRGERGLPLTTHHD